MTEERTDVWVAVFDHDALVNRPGWAACYCLEPPTRRWDEEPAEAAVHPWQQNRADMVELLHAGRSFGFTGLHYHKNWSREDYRRLLTQGVLWTLKVPMPTTARDLSVPDDLLK